MALAHRVEDGAAAQVRARRSFAPGWHPILAAVEESPGEWYLMAQYGTCYGVVRFLHIGGEWGYRAVTWAERSDERRLIGYFVTFRAACAATHRRYLAAHGQNGSPNGR